MKRIIYSTLVGVGACCLCAQTASAQSHDRLQEYGARFGHYALAQCRLQRVALKTHGVAVVVQLDVEAEALSALKAIDGIETVRKVLL